MNTLLDDSADVRATLERALHDVIPPADCARSAIMAGRRIRRRRRVGIAAGWVAAAAVIGAVTVPNLRGWDSPPNEGIGGPASAPSRMTAATTDAGTPTPGSGNPFPEVQRSEGWWDMPGNQILAELERLLPSGITVQSSEIGTGGGGILAGPTGPGRFQILLQPPPLKGDEIPEPVTSTDAQGNEVTSVWGEGVPHAKNIRCGPLAVRCEFIRDEAGKKIGVVTSELDQGTTYHNMHLLGPDGGAVYLYVADSPGEKPGYRPLSAEQPPLTFKQVKALALDPVWTSYEPERP